MVQVEAVENDNPSSRSNANFLLDKLLARTATLNKKLAGMTQSGQVSHLETPSRLQSSRALAAASRFDEQPNPSVVLDSCLNRAHALHGEVDRLAMEVSARRALPGGQGTSVTLGEDYTRQENLQVMSKLHGAHDAAEIVPVGDAAEGDWDIDENEANISAQMNPATQVRAITAHAVAADTRHLAAVQVQVCSVEFKGAASDLPVGTVDADTITKPQAAPAESGKLHAEAHAVAADSMQPAAVQVQVC